jgi:hypothetical protein
MRSRTEIIASAVQPQTSNTLQANNRASLSLVSNTETNNLSNLPATPINNENITTNLRITGGVNILGPSNTDQRTLIQECILVNSSFNETLETSRTTVILQNLKKAQDEKMLEQLLNKDENKKNHESDEEKGPVTIFVDKLSNNDSLADAVKNYAEEPEKLAAITEILQESEILGEVDPGFLEFLSTSIRSVFGDSRLSRRVGYLFNIVNYSSSWTEFVEQLKDLIKSDNRSSEEEARLEELLINFQSEMIHHFPLLLHVFGVMNQNFFSSLDVESIRLLFNMLSSKNFSNIINSFGVEFVRELIFTSDNLNEFIKNYQKLTEQLSGISANYVSSDAIEVVEISPEEKENLQKREEEITNINSKHSNSNFVDVICQLLGIELSNFLKKILYFMSLAMFGSLFISGIGLFVTIFFSMYKLYPTVQIGSNIIVRSEPQNLKEIFKILFELVKKKFL